MQKQVDWLNRKLGETDMKLYDAEYRASHAEARVKALEQDRIDFARQQFYEGVNYARTVDNASKNGTNGVNKK